MAGKSWAFCMGFLEMLSTYGHQMGLVSHGIFQKSAPKFLPSYPGTVSWKVHRTFQAIWVVFESRARYQNFRAFFWATLKTTRRFSIAICYVERGQCCSPIYLTSAKQHAKKKRILVLNWNCECCTTLHGACAGDNHHLTWRPHQTPAPPDYVQPYANASWVVVEVHRCHEIMMKNLTLRHLL